MGDFNPTSPTLLGQEWQPISEQALVFGSPGAGYAERIRPGAVTLGAIHRHHQEVIGSAPGVALEVVDTLMPTITSTSYFPGTDLGASTTTGWQDQAAGVATFARLDDKTDITDYLRNTGAVNIYEQRNIRFRGGASALSGKRIALVTMTALLRCLSFSNTTDIGIEGALTLGGNSYYSPLRRVPNDARWYTLLIGGWRLNPSTDKPWTQADVNNIIQAAGTDSFGWRLSYPRPAAINTQAFHVAGLWLDVVMANENRLGGFYYDARKALRYWQRFALSSAGALSANTWYWLVEYPLVGGTGNFIRGVAHTDAKMVEGASAASAAGEHRELVACTIYNGIVTAVAPDLRTVQDSAVTAGTPGQLLGGTLLENNAAAILSQSDPYVQLDRRKIASDSTANIGQRITSAGGTTYGAVLLPVAWNKTGVRPDRELTIEIRHGAGALTGGGTLDATATLKPDDINGTLQRVQVPFTASFLSIATQYVAIIKSSANTASGWDIVRLDTHSDQIDAAAGTTVANVEGATQGGTTDSYVENGAANTRYDIPVALIAAPTAPAGFTATALPAVVNSAPPRVLCSWTATALGSSFSKYRVWSRPSRTPALAWVLRAEIDVSAGQTAATVEAQHTKWIDKSPGWTRTAGTGQWGDGFDYMVTVVNAATGLESAASTIASRVQLTPDVDSWLLSNTAPWLDAPVWAQELDGEDQGTLNRYAALGRNYQLTRTRSELPGRVYKVAWDSMQAVGEDGIRFQRAAAVSGRQLVLNTPAGDRVIGAISAPSPKQTAADFIDSTATFIETDRDPEIADYNLPCGLVLNGSSQFLSTPDNALLNPGAGAFTILVAGAFSYAASRVLFGKGNAGTADGWWIRTTANANELQFFVDGATTSGGPLITSAAFFDGNIHCAIGRHTNGAQSLNIDDSTTPTTTSVTTGAITNAIAAAMGANNAGASGFASGQFVIACYWPRLLTDTEALAAARDALFYPNARMPGGANLFVDLRDQRTWNGIALTIVDTSGNNLPITATAAPTPRGVPWPLADLDRF